MAAKTATSSAGPRGDDSGRGRENLEEPTILPRRWIITILVVVLLGLGALFIYVLQFNGSVRVSVLGVGMVVAAASLVLGGITGLLFGVPRAARGAPPGGGDGGGNSESLSTDMYSSNTNLEEVSDWLTKILVGVGLTQIAGIGAALTGLGGFLAPGLGDVPSSQVFAVGLVLYFLASGFILGYLLTKRFLEQLFAAGKVKQLRQKLSSTESQLQDKVALERATKDELGETKLALTRADEELADRKVSTQGTEDEDLAGLATQYMGLRADKPAGQERTREMSTVVAAARASAQESPPDQSEIEALYCGRDGGRVIALAVIQTVDPKPAFFNLILGSIDDSRSAFEQYQALQALDHVWAGLSDVQKQEACRAIADQRGEGDGKWIVPGTDRWALSESLRRKLGCA